MLVGNADLPPKGPHDLRFVAHLNKTFSRMFFRRIHRKTSECGVCSRKCFQLKTRDSDVFGFKSDIGSLTQKLHEFLVFGFDSGIGKPLPRMIGSADCVVADGNICRNFISPVLCRHTAGKISGNGIEKTRRKLVREGAHAA